MFVHRDDLEAALNQLTRDCREPVLGPWGPGSVLWRISREKGVLLAGGRAALLQLAHPYVGEAVSASALAVSDPMLRFRRTFTAVYGMVFGTLQDALETARRVYRIHEGVGGSLPAAGRYADGHRYAANEVPALEWVLATLIDGSVLAYELICEPLSAEDRERFYQDAKKVGLLFGLTALPETWADFERSFAATLGSDALAVTERAGEVGRRLLLGPDLATAPLWATYRALTAELLPERFHAPFHLRHGRAESALARSALALLKRGYRVLPERVRCVPAWNEARWRVEGQGTRVDRVGRWLEETSLSVMLRPPAGGARAR